MHYLLLVRSAQSVVEETVSLASSCVSYSVDSSE